MDSFDLTKAPKTKQFVDEFINVIDTLTSNKELMELKRTDYNKFLNDVFEVKEFQPFIDNYFNFFMLLISNEKPPFEIINMFIYYKVKIELNEITQEQADKEIAEYMNNKFIYSKFGGKRNFERTIINKHHKNTKQKRF